MKKVYVQPKLVKHGQVETLTLGSQYPRSSQPA